MGTENRDPPLPPRKGPKCLSAGEKFSAKCRGARTRDALRDVLREGSLPRSLWSEVQGAHLDPGPALGHSQGCLKWDTRSPSVRRWGHGVVCLPLPGWSLGLQETLSAAVGTLVCTGRDLVSNVGCFMPFDRFVPVSLCVVI